MNTTASGIDPVVAVQTTKNLELARRAVAEALANLDAAESGPDDAGLILIPYDDPVLGVLNLGLANTSAAAGNSVRLQRVGVPAPDAPGERERRALDGHAAHLRPKWPAAAARADLVPAYDPDDDHLVIDFFDGARRPDAVLLMNRSVLLLIDTAAEEAVGLWIPNFVARVRRHDPLMGELLLLTFAPVDGLTRPEAARLRDEIGFGVRPAASLGSVVDLWDPARFARRIA